MHPDAAALGFVHIGGADALFGGADGGAFLRFFGFAERVELEVPRHDAVGARVDEQLAGGDALRVQAVDLAKDGLRVDDHARADHIGAGGIKDPRGDQLELVFHAVCNDRVARVVAALAAYHQIRFRGKNINEFALSFVAPLGA